MIYEVEKERYKLLYFNSDISYLENNTTFLQIKRIQN